MGLKQLIRNAGINGPLRPLAKRLHKGLVSAALQGERWADYFVAGDNAQGFVNDDLTVVIKTFERPVVLLRLVTSIRVMYPGLRIIVVDDSENPVRLAGVEVIAMPYDSGISVGRNEALDRVTTKYLLLLDDDFVFSRATQLSRVMEQLEHHPEIDIVGGEVIYLPFYGRMDYHSTTLYPTKAKSLRDQGTAIDGLEVLDKVANFFVARTESLRKVRWDSRLKRMEHADFFTRAKGVLLTTFDSKFRVLHARTPFDAAYMCKRMDLDEAQAIVWEKYYSEDAGPSHDQGSQLGGR